MAVSYHHHLIKVGTLEEGTAFDRFMEGFLNAELHARFATWGEHVGSWLGTRRDDKGFLLVRYEDMVDDTVGQLRRIVSHPDIPADDASLQQAVELITLNKMRRDETGTQRQPTPGDQVRSDMLFVRATRSSGWETELSASSARRIEVAWGTGWNSSDTPTESPRTHRLSRREVSS